MAGMADSVKDRPIGWGVAFAAMNGSRTSGPLDDAQLAAERRVAAAGATVLDVARQAAEEACVAAGGDGHVVPTVTVTGDDVADTPTSAKVHGDRPSAAPDVRDGQIDSGALVGEDQPQLVGRFRRSGGDLGPWRGHP